MPSPQRPDPGATPTADAVERWLRRVNPLLDAVTQYLAAGAPRCDRSGGDPVEQTPEVDDDDAALATNACALAGEQPDRPVVPFPALTACPGSRGRRGNTTRPCRHAHVELLIAEEAGTERGGPRYGVRVVNVDLPRSRHREAFIAPAPTWPDQAAAAAEGLRLARERWGEVAVVHRTPFPSRAG